MSEFVRNSDGWFVNTAGFQEEARHFRKYGYYTEAPWGSDDWFNYWRTQQDRFVNGYTVGGVRITGAHYYYLNFCPINRTNIKKRQKGTDFPDFWDYDYNYFHIVDIARSGCTEDELKKLNLEIKPLLIDGGHHLVVAKKRRAGYSYKNAALVSCIANTVRGALTIIGASDTKYLYPEGTMAMVTNYLDFMNEHTGLAKKREYVDKVSHRRLSFKEYQNGIPIEKGYKSDIMAVTFRDNPDAARGKDAYLCLFEEAGKFPNLLQAYNATRPSLEDGVYVTGQLLCYGTGGSFDSGGMEFAEMFYNPLTYNMLPFENVWDSDARGTSCGFFVPAYKTLVGFIDEAGNSLTEKALEHELKIRESIKDGKGGMLAYNLHIQEYPHNPAEAFLQAGDNPFPIETLTPIRNKLLREDRYKVLGKPVKLFYDENKVKYKIDMTGSVNPIYRYPAPSAQVKSGVIMYEAPPDNPPRGLFLIGYDPVNQDEGTSLASFFVYKTGIPYTETHNTIVAEYTGREDTTDDVNQILLMVAELYNADIMHENMSKDTITYFRTRRKMDRLLGQPDAVIQAATQKSVVRRKAGVHMTPALFSDGIKYINNWLLSVHHLDENEEEVLNAELIPSIGLLDEMISYRKKGNFDRLIAFIMIMFSVKENEIYTTPRKASYREELEVFLQTKIMRGAKSKPKRFKYIES